MNISQIITNAITVLLAVIGWRIGHYYNTKRDKELKRREIATEHLINAYRVLANDVTQREVTFE
jgi:hypothetical protein